MIEVEKKFFSENENKEKLKAVADFISQKDFTDIYFDDALFSLTTKDTWLRKRDDRYELKISMNESIEKRISDHYRELETEEEIADYLNLNTNIPFADALIEKGYLPFCSITTTRTKYKKGKFGIDLDSTDFGYTLAEIEIMVEKKEEIPQAVEKIIAFGKELGFSSGLIRGKVSEYLRIKNPVHFQALVDAKVIK